MKRDIDLARQLLLDIENRGIDCSMSVLRSGPDQETEERIRYHLRLLIDAGMLKEVDRTSSGIPCLRLTHDGHELLELSRHEGRWRDAKTACHARIGGLSLAVIRQLLIRSAIQPRRSRRARGYFPPQRYNVARRPLGYRADAQYTYAPLAYGPQPFEAYTREEYPRDTYRYENVEADLNADLNNVDGRDWWFDGPSRPPLARTELRNGYRPTGIDLDGDGRADVELDATFPDHLL